MRLISALTEGSGKHNEDAYGFAGTADHVTAAWVLDGVTGINAETLLDVPSEPAWFAATANRHLRDVVSMKGDALDVLKALVPRLAEEWYAATRGTRVPDGYDLPAACLLLARQYEGRWQVLRLGDSYVLSDTTNHPFPPNDLPDLEAELKTAARARRDAGMLDVKSLLAEFRPRLMANRRGRNKPESYSILEPNEASLIMPQLLELGHPRHILLCTDGFYRAVDIYGLCDDAELMSQNIAETLRQVRATEADDPRCEKHLRFKPADDATAIRLTQ